MSSKKLIVGITSVIIVCVMLISTANAGKSVYVISSTNANKVQAYKVDANSLTYQTEYDTTYSYPVGIAIDESEYGQYLFLTFENQDEIEVVDAKSMQYVDTIIAPQASDLAGLVFDGSKDKLYTINRDDGHLYVYSWDAENRELTLVYDDPYYIELEDCTEGYGLALDEENELLYVGDDTNDVKYYDTNDWSKGGEISITDSAIGIAIDVPNQYLYTGPAWLGGSYYLTQYDLGSSTENRVEVGSSVLGIAVDEDTGYVYLTTYGDGDVSSRDRLMVYDPNLTKHWSSGDIGDPAGCAVSDVGYKAPFFSIVKDNNDVDCVYPYNWLYYNIAWDANGYADSNVVIVDYLPIEVDEPNLISDGGVYDSNEHTVTWDLNDISANDSNEFQIRVGVNAWARPGGVITNKAQIEGDEYLSWHIIDTNVCAWGTEIIYVDEDANDPNSFNNGTDWDNAYTDLRDAFTGAQNCGAAVTAIWVAAGLYKPVYEMDDLSQYKYETFDLIEDVGLFGHFGGVGTYETSTSQRNFADANNTTILEGKIGESVLEAVYDVLTADNIEDAVVDGFTIKGSYSGSGIFLDSSDVSVVNCKFKNNYNYGIEVTDYSYPDIHNCTFMDNSSAGVYSTVSQPDISYCSFDGNSTTAQGLNLVSGSSINVTDCIFKNHTGDGIYGSNATLTVTDSNFESNNDNALELYTDVTTTLTNCSIKNSGDDGIYTDNSDLTMEHCLIDHTTDYGIRMKSYSNLTLKNSVVRYSGAHGLYLIQNSATTITNNWIHNNGTDQIASRASGIYFYNQIGIPLIRNNTIYDNFTYGIESTEQGADPNVINCIIYDNDSNDFYRENGTFDTVNYCCLEDGHAGTGNITTAPTFKNPTDPNDLHQDETSATKDAGDPNGDYGDETDIDGEARIIYGRVDIGADEYYWSPADFNGDGKVNFTDYAMLADAWQTENAAISLDEDNDVDINDLALFCEDWLWLAGWMKTEEMMMGGLGRSSTTEFYNITPQAIAESKTVRPKPPTMREPYELYELYTEMLEGFDEIWLSGGLKEVMTEDEYLESRKAIEESVLILKHRIDSKGPAIKVGPFLVVF